MLVLDSGNTESTKIVTSAELESKDQVVKPSSNKIPIVHYVTEPNEWNIKRQDVRLSLSDTKDFVVAIVFISDSVNA